jgi:GcrA cell cycle regulator
MNNADREAACWPAEKKAALIELQATGKTFAEIALAVGASRNAVAGKCSRLGLATATIDSAVHRARALKGVANREARLLALRPAPIEPRNISYLDRSRFECSYPYGASGAYTCCGLPVTRGAFCSGHAAISYRRAA